MACRPWRRAVDRTWSRLVGCLTTWSQPRSRSGGQAVSCPSRWRWMWSHGNFGHTGGVRFSQPLNCTFLIFSGRLLNSLLAMYLVSNKVDSNLAKITVFLHLSYN